MADRLLRHGDVSSCAAGGFADMTIKASLRHVPVSCYFVKITLTSFGKAKPAATSTALVIPMGTGQAACLQFTRQAS
jgi:hypothetical protein